jgi:hypothetical protein
VINYPGYYLLQMKKLTLLIFLTILTISAEAQSKSSLVYGNALIKDRKMQKAGTVLIAIGGAALFTGNIMYWKIYNDYGNNDVPGDKVNRSVDIMAAGIGLMAVGIPLLTIGKSKERHLKIEAELIRFRSYASANGFGLKIRF